MFDIDVDETATIISKDSLPSGRLGEDERRPPTEAFASENTSDAVTVEMRHEVRHDKGQVDEREVRALPQNADHNPLLVRRLPGRVTRASGMVLTLGGTTLAPFADVLGADPIALRKRAAWFRRSGDFRVGNGRGLGIWMDLEYGPPPSQNRAPEALKSAATRNHGTADRIPIMFRDQRVNPKQEVGAIRFELA
jgi:hypothetical protein